MQTGAQNGRSAGFQFLGESPQVPDDFLRRCRAIFTVFGQALADDELEFHRHARPHAGQRLGLLMDDLVQQCLVVLALERPLPADHLVQHDAQRPEVGATVGLLSHCLFRRHVGGGAQDRARLCEL